MRRLDVHAPSHPDFDPAAYELVDVYDLHYKSGDHRLLNREIDELTKRGIVQAPHAVGCGHCGQTGLRYVALLVRADVNEWIFVGQDCLAARFTAMTKAKFAELRRDAELARKKQVVKTAWLAFCAENPAMAWATYADNISLSLRREARELGLDRPGVSGDDHLFASGVNWGLNVLFDIARKSRQYGSASEKQVALVERILGELETKWSAYLAKQAEKAANPAGPAPTGRQEIEGVLLSTKSVETDFGTTYKMVVKLDNGSRAYGTVPAAIGMVERGDWVRFTATFELSGDKDFAFFKRPTKASVVASAQKVA